MKRANLSRKRILIFRTVILLAALSASVPGAAFAASLRDDTRTGFGITTFLPYAPYSGADITCPVSSEQQYALGTTISPSEPRPDYLHADLNLSLRGYEQISAYLGLVTYSGATDWDPPQLPNIFIDVRVPQFTAAYRVHDWDWSCDTYGCPGPLLDDWFVTLVGMRTTPSEPLRMPSRRAQIKATGHQALVLYAEERRITLGYTAEDSVAFGYAVHIEGVCVDPNLLSLYRWANAQGRASLPLLGNDQILGVAASESIEVSVRDRGTFMDPRSRKDWWQAP